MAIFKMMKSVAIGSYLSSKGYAMAKQVGFAEPNPSSTDPSAIQGSAPQGFLQVGKTQSNKPMSKKGTPLHVFGGIAATLAVSMGGLKQVCHIEEREQFLAPHAAAAALNMDPGKIVFIE